MFRVMPLTSTAMLQGGAPLQIERKQFWLVRMLLNDSYQLNVISLRGLAILRFSCFSSVSLE
jgi:hypothetical protein